MVSTIVNGIPIVRDIDYLLTPIYVVLLCTVVGFIYVKYYRKTMFGQLFVAGFMMKLIFLGLRLVLSLVMFAEESDVYKYYEGANGIHQAFKEDPLLAAEIIVESPDTYSMRAKDFAFRWLNRTSTGTVIKVAGLIGLLTFNSYVVISLMFGMLAFVGCVLIFETLRRIYPKAFVYLAVACLFVPSVVFWSNMISKDALAIFALGLITYTSFEIIFHRRGGAIKIAGLLLGCYLLFLVKSYILMTYAASLAIPVLFALRLPFAERSVRLFAKGIIAIMIIAAGFLVLAKIGAEHVKFSVEGVTELTENLEGQEEFGGSSYHVTMFNLTPSGIIFGAAQAMMISLFKPTIIEANRMILLPSALENTILFLLSIFVMLRVGIRTTFSMISHDRVLSFCLLFTVLFAIISGLFSWNYGALVRYRMPYVPFFVSLLGVIYFNWSQARANYKLSTQIQ